MSESIGGRRARKLIAGAAIVAAPAAALLALSSATASADEIGVDRTVTSRQGTVSGDATFGEVRGAEDWLHAQGEVRDSTKAVPDRLDGTRARGFLPSWSGGPGMGSW
jgi:hypothetical protein